MRPGVPRRRRAWGTTLLPPNPYRFAPNWGSSLVQGLAGLFLPAANGTYFDVVHGRRLVFGGANVSNIVPVATALGNAYQIGAAGGGQNAYALVTDGALQPPVTGTGTGMSMAVGAFNPATIANVLCVFGNLTSPSFTNRLTLYVQNSSGVPRMSGTVEVAGSAINIIANGGAGVTMVTAGQYMTYAMSYSEATGGSGTLLLDYTTTGLGHNTGGSTTTGFPSGMTEVCISDPSGAAVSMSRAAMFLAWWNRALSAAELQAVTAGIGGLPADFLRWK